MDFHAQQQVPDDELLSWICANESLHDGGAEVTDCRRNRKQGKRVYCQHMLHYGISGHFQALANVLKRRIKSVSPDTDQLTTWIFWCLPSNVFTSRRQTLKWSSCNSSIHMFMASCGMLMLLWRTVANTFGTEGNLCKPRWKLLKLLFRLTRSLNIFTITNTKQLSLAHHGLVQLSNYGLHGSKKNIG